MVSEQTCHFCKEGEGHELYDEPREFIKYYKNIICEFCVYEMMELLELKDQISEDKLRKDQLKKEILFNLQSKIHSNEIDIAEQFKKFPLLVYYNWNAKIKEWPSKRKNQEKILIVLSCLFEENKKYNDLEVTRTLENATLDKVIDPATLRRKLIEMNLLKRNRDGSIYEKV